MPRKNGRDSKEPKKGLGNTPRRKGESGGWLGEALLNNRDLDDVVDLYLSVLNKRRGSGTGHKELLDILERRIIARVMFEFNGSQIRAANFLNLNPSTLHEKMKKYGILVRGRNLIPLRSVIPLGFKQDEDLPSNPPRRQPVNPGNGEHPQRLNGSRPYRKAN